MTRSRAPSSPPHWRRRARPRRPRWRRTTELPRAQDPGKATPAPSGKGKTLQGLQAAAAGSARSRRPSTKARAGDTIKIAQRHLPRGRHDPRREQALPQAHRQPAAPGKVVLEGGGGRQNGILVNGADEVTVRGFKATHYKANGFFFVNVVGYTRARPDRRRRPASTASTRSTPRAARCATPRPTTHSDARLLHRADAGAGQAGPLDRHATSSPGATRSAGRGTNMRYVTITESRFYNNGDRDRPERAGLREVPAARRTTSSATTTSSGTTSTSTPARRSSSTTSGVVRARARSAPASCCSAGGATASRTTASTATTWSASARSRRILLEENPQARALVGNIVRDNAVRARRHRPQRPRPGLRRQRHRQLLLGQHRRVGDDPGRRLDVRRLPVRGRQRVQRRHAGRAGLASPARPPSPGGSSTRTRPSRASRRWRCTCRETAPDSACRASPPAPRCCARRRPARTGRSARP